MTKAFFSTLPVDIVSQINEFAPVRALNRALSAEPGLTEDGGEQSLPPKMHKASQLVADGIATERKFKALDINTGLGTLVSNEAKFGGTILDNPVTEFVRGIIHSETLHTKSSSIWFQFVGAGIGCLGNDIPKTYGYGISTIYMWKALRSLQMGDCKDDPYEREQLQSMINAYLFRSPFIISEKILQTARFGLLGAFVLAGQDTLAESFMALFLAKMCGIVSTYGNWAAMNPAVNRTQHEKRVLRAREEGKLPAKVIDEYIRNAFRILNDQNKVSNVSKFKLDDWKLRLNDIRSGCFAESAHVSAELMRLEREISQVQKSFERSYFRMSVDTLLGRKVASEDEIMKNVVELRQQQKEILNGYVKVAARYLAQTHSVVAEINSTLTGEDHVVELPNIPKLREAIQQIEAAVELTTMSDELEVSQSLVSVFSKNGTEALEIHVEKDKRLNLAQISAAFNGFYDSMSSAMYHGLTMYFTVVAMSPGTMTAIVDRCLYDMQSMLGNSSAAMPVIEDLHDLNAQLGGAIEFPMALMVGLTMFSMVGPANTFRKAVQDRFKAMSEGKETDKAYFTLSVMSELLKSTGLSVRYIPVMRPISLMSLGFGTYVEGIMHSWHDKSKRQKYTSRIGWAEELYNGISKMFRNS